MLTSPQQSQEMLNQLRERYEVTATQDTAGKRRAKAWERFLQLGLPSRQQEVFRYVPLRRFFEGRYTTPLIEAVSMDRIAPHVLPECLHSHVVFVNGHFQRSLSDLTQVDPKIIVHDLCEADQHFGVFMSNHWTQGLKEERDPFAVLNAALQGRGLFLYVPPDCEASMPIQIIHILSTDQALTLPRAQVIVSKDASVSLIHTTVDDHSDAYANSSVIDFIVEDNGSVNYIQHASNLTATSWHFNALRAKLKKDSRLHMVSFNEGARTFRNDYRVTLMGENADAALNDLWMLDEKYEAHANVLIEHQAPHCRSQQLFKGVLTDFSRSSFEGKILVQRPAQKTEAYQLNNNLLLSDGANADSKPNLEIFADDVKASHGATVGQLDAEQLFYLQARGLADAEAKTLLVNGFAREIVDLIGLNSLHDQLLTRVRTFFA